MGAARLLFDYLVAKQYDGGIDGAVNHGRALTVDQIRAEIPNSPDARTIRRYVRTLREHGYIRTHRTYRHGLRFWILNQKKFQLGLPFTSKPELVPSRTGPVEKPVEMLIDSCDLPKSERTSFVLTDRVSGQGCPKKSLELESIKERKSESPAGEFVTPDPQPFLDQKPKPEIDPPAASPAFEQLLLRSRSDSSEKTKFVEALRVIAAGKAMR